MLSTRVILGLDSMIGAGCSPLRASAESANRFIDDHHPRGERLHHYGFEKNNLSMLAWQAYRNAQTEQVFINRNAVDPALMERTGLAGPESLHRNQN